MQKRAIAAGIGAAAVAAAGIGFGLRVSGGASAGPAATSTPKDVVYVPEIGADREVPSVTVQVTQEGNSASLQLPIAANEAERERGLMWITSMPQDQGMLFLFPEDGTVGFWMENTYIPLDIVFIADNGAVLSVAHGEPLSTKILLPPSPYRFVIETNARWWESHGFTPGAIVHFPANLPAAT